MQYSGRIRFFRQCLPLLRNSIAGALNLLVSDTHDFSLMGLGRLLQSLKIRERIGVAACAARGLTQLAVTSKRSYL